MRISIRCAAAPPPQDPLKKVRWGSKRRCLVAATEDTRVLSKKILGEYPCVPPPLFEGSSAEWGQGGGRDCKPICCFARAYDRGDSSLLIPCTEMSATRNSTEGSCSPTARDVYSMNGSRDSNIASEYRYPLNVSTLGGTLTGVGQDGPPTSSMPPLAA